MPVGHLSPRVGDIQRRAIQVDGNGDKVWRDFDAVTTFEGQEEAREYARKNAVEDVEL